MQDVMSPERFADARGRTVYSSDGEKIGEVEEIFVDDQTDRVEWVGIGTGLFGKRVLVPTEGLADQGQDYTVPYSKDQVKDSPSIDDDDISQQTERDLYAHYGLGYSKEESDTGLPTGGQARSTAGEGDEIVRSEEELQVGKRDVETGRARVRKWVETEPASMDVDLQRETARVSRERIDEPVSDAEFGEDEIDVPLREEQPVVAKQAVAKERITVDKDVETERQTVGDEVRKERVDVDEDIERS